MQSRTPQRFLPLIEGGFIELIDQLVSSVGVSEEQAECDAGMLFKLAQDKISGDEFAQIADKVSGLDDTLSAAPDVADGGPIGAVGSLRSGIGGESTDLGALAGLAGGFEKLGLESGMVRKFVPSARFRSQPGWLFGRQSTQSSVIAELICQILVDNRRETRPDLKAPAVQSDMGSVTDAVVPKCPLTKV